MDRQTMPSAAGQGGPSVRREPVQVVPLRRWGQWLVGAIVAIIFASIVQAAVTNDQFDWSAVGDYLFASEILSAVWRSLVLTLAAQGIGIALGLGLALLRLSQNPALAVASWIYTWVFRAVPALVQLILWFNIGVVFSDVSISIPFTDVTLFSTPANKLISALTASLLGLGLSEGANMAEVIRGGILSVNKGQAEAAMSLGMTRNQAMRRIVLPQAVRVIIPPTSTQLISMLKATALVSVIAYSELLATAQRIYATNLKTLELLVVASIWYLVLTSVLLLGQFFLERYLGRSNARVQNTPGSWSKVTRRFWPPPRNA